MWYICTMLYLTRYYTSPTVRTVNAVLVCPCNARLLLVLGHLVGKALSCSGVEVSLIFPYSCVPMLFFLPIQPNMA